MGFRDPFVISQATSLVVFSLKDKKQLTEISEECSGEISPEVFMKVYERAIQGKHDFLFIDLHPKSNHASGFRKSFDESFSFLKKHPQEHP